MRNTVTALFTSLLLQSVSCTSVEVDVPAPVMLRLASIDVQPSDSELPPVHFEYFTMWYERQVMFVFERGSDGTVRRISFETASDTSEVLSQILDLRAIGGVARSVVVPP